MSLWLQSAIECLENRDYKEFREKLLPHAHIPIPVRGKLFVLNILIML